MTSTFLNNLTKSPENGRYSSCQNDFITPNLKIHAFKLDVFKNSRYVSLIIIPIKQNIMKNIKRHDPFALKKKQ